MIKHIVTWRFYDTLSASERQSAALKLKHDMEALQTQIDGVLSLAVIIDPLPTSNRDILLESTFVSAEALALYQNDPRPPSRRANTSAPSPADRACIDFRV